ncbi:hypothetical protein [Halomicrococcus gelatinilyticus]
MDAVGIVLAARDGYQCTVSNGEAAVRDAWEVVSPPPTRFLGEHSLTAAERVGGEVAAGRVLVLDADETAVPRPATAATREGASATRTLGHGDEDVMALLKHLEAVRGWTVGEG